MVDSVGVCLKTMLGKLGHSLLYGLQGSESCKYLQVIIENYYKIISIWSVKMAHIFNWVVTERCRRNIYFHGSN
jgi:hypothetical protein